MPETFDIFFSYDRDDAQWVERVGSALEERGLRTWVDSSEIAAAERWAERLETGLRTSRVYALIVTRKALQSRWVMDEYYSALALANSPGHNLQLVPLLVEEVELPIFLSIRQWIDFRDPEKFDQSLERLCRSILAARGDGSTESVSRESESPATEGDATLEARLQYLGRALRREAQTIREMWAVRIAAAAVGIVLYSWLVATGSAPDELILAGGMPLFTGLIGWGATSQRVAAARVNQDKLVLLREGLEMSKGRSEKTREKLQNEFWRVVHGKAGLAAA